MADYSCRYHLGAITFNDGTFGHGSTDDLYWIDTIHGLDGPTLRVPQDDVPFGDGGIVHRSWKGARHPIFEGRLMVQSVGLGSCQEVLNDMEDALNAALDAILAPNSTALTWTPTGGSLKSLTVFYEQQLEVQPADNYRTRSFSFGLVSESASF